MTDFVKYAGAGALIVATLLALDSLIEILNGNLKRGLTPGWVDFAISYPVLFAIIAVLGVAILGKPAQAVLESA